MTAWETVKDDTGFQSRKRILLTCGNRTQDTLAEKHRVKR